MDFSIAKHIEAVLDTIRELMERDVYPLERAAPVATILRTAARAARDSPNGQVARPVGAADAPVVGRGRAQLHGIRSGWRRARQEPPGALCRQRPGTRRRQYGNPPRVRHRRPARALALPARARRGSQLLCHDRARPCRFQSGLDEHDGGPRWRSLRIERPQVVCLGGRRIELRHRDGGHRFPCRGLPPPA